MLKMLLIHEAATWHVIVFTKVSAQARKQVWAGRKNQNEQEKDTEGEFSYPTHLI